MLLEGLQGKICPVRLGVVCPLVLREGYQGKACLCICSLSPGAPRRTPGEDFVRLSVVCPLVYSVKSARGMPGEGFMCGVVCLMVYFEMGSMGRLVCHVCSLSPGTPRGVPGEGLSVFM